MIISPAMMKIFEECPQKYKYIYIDKINLPQNKYFYQKGKNIHAMANYYLKGFNIDKLEVLLSKDEKSIWTYLKNCNYFKYDCIGSEYQLSCKVDNKWIGGRLDAFVKNKEDYYILDYKTGSVPENAEYDYQTMVYLLCADAFLKKYHSLKFIYIDLKNKTEKIINFDEQLKQEYTEKIKNILSAINLMKISQNLLLKNNKCKCDYYCICDKN